MSPSQRAILSAMRDQDYARFYQGLTIGLQIHPYETRDGEAPGGVWVMYGARAAPPELALERAGLIERVARNVPGDWWKLSDAGHDRMMPRPPRKAREPKWWHLRCAYCQGTGKVPSYAYGGGERHGDPIKCRECSGRGTRKAANPYHEGDRA